MHRTSFDDGKEKYILFAVSCGNEEKAEASIKELEELLKTAGGESCAYMIQNIEKPDRTTYIGKGKALELKEMVEFLEADGVVCDDELTPSQHRNLADILETKVVDRTMLILDIFAKRATTGEGKLQVEMAQLKYRASRLTGKGTALSRLGGGIGTRGPGETKLETDRRAIQRRLDKLTADVKALKHVRETTRKKRLESAAPIVAIVGYTNAGKSTLLNRLTSADILAEDKLFATLDPTTRVCRLPNGREIMFTDTVGFINKLPHQLIDAFRSTLEEAKFADMILHVIDATSEDVELHKEVVYDTLKNLGVEDKPVVTAFNKIDLLADSRDLPLTDENADAAIDISAATGKGINELFAVIENEFREKKVYLEQVIMYNDQDTLKRIKKYGQIIEEEYTEEGVAIKAYVPPNMIK
ncbi:MAG: GTPase HflX [Firmicutes bacterium]|nr:GTPase HflX [Bacillota bacterium]